LRDDAIYERSAITLFKNANLSLKELEIAGAALLAYNYSEEYRYAVVEAEPCDPNILGIISDMILEVDAVDTCLVYSVLPFGIKLSVRSCIKETKASELAEFITAGIGSGGGHLEKAGGFIQSQLLEKAYVKYQREPNVAEFLKWRMTDYFDDVEIIHAKDYKADLTDAVLCRKKKVPVGFVRVADVFDTGTRITVRTLEGDLDIEVQDDVYIIIGIKGEIYPNKREKFERAYDVLDTPYVFEGEYEPMVKDIVEGKHISLVPYAKSCVSSGDVSIYVKQLDHRVKIFTHWDEEKYMLGCEGDYLAVRTDDLSDVYVIEKAIFEKTYIKV
jgi:phosphoglycolate phosphatase